MDMSSMTGMAMPASSSTGVSSTMAPGMGMGMPMASNTDSSSGALSTDGLDMTNITVQSDFLAQLLDDLELQVTSNHYATIFWYGIVVVIGLATLSNLILILGSRSRYALPSSKSALL